MLPKKLRSNSHANTSARIPSVGPVLQKLNSTSNIPEDVIAKILCCLPVKPLLSFRCVSKPWCSLIDSPHFVKTHLQKSCSLVDSPHFVKTHLQKSIECKANTGLIIRGPTFYSANFDSVAGASAIEIDEPLRTYLYNSAVVGSYHGLFCLFNTKTNIFLWNPATRKCKQLCSPPTDFEFSQSNLYGFGYDSDSDDYKVVGINQSSCDGFVHSKIIVYDLKTNVWRWVQNVTGPETNRWRRVQNRPSRFRFNGVWGMFVGGALNWIRVKTLESKSCLTIIAFDLKVEQFYELPTPKFQNEKVDNMSLTVFEERLCILDNHPNHHMDVWAMNEYGVENSWSKLFSVEQQIVISPYEFVTPLAYSKNCRDVLLEVGNKKLMWYNLNRKKVRDIKIFGIPTIFESEVYIESLVPLGNSDLKQLQKHKKTKNTRTIRRRT